MTLLWYVCDDVTPSEKQRLCELAKNGMKQIKKLLSECVYEGCSACCGFDYVPSADQLGAIPPCCD